MEYLWCCAGRNHNNPFRCGAVSLLVSVNWILTSSRDSQVSVCATTLMLSWLWAKVFSRLISFSTCSCVIKNVDRTTLSLKVWVRLKNVNGVEENLPDWLDSFPFILQLFLNGVVLMTRWHGVCKEIHFRIISKIDVFLPISMSDKTWAEACTSKQDSWLVR